MKSIALYARVSSEQQAQQATVESQIAELKQRAESDGHVVLPQDIYVDEGFSGATLVRPALERLRDRAAEGAIELLYVHSPDRLARKYAYQVLLLDELRRHGVMAVFLHGPAGQTAEDELLVQVQGMIAEYERAKILERCRRGKIHRARHGSVNPMSGAPYGFAYIKKSDDAPASYRVLLHEAKVVRGIFHALVHEQKSIGEIVRNLNAQKIPTRRAAPRWDRATVWAILQNPAHMGKAAFGKTEATERRKLLRPIRNKAITPRRAKGAHRDKPREQWISIDVPAIVTRDVFDAAKEQLARNKQLSQRNARGERYLLQGLTTCSRCGYAFYGKTVSKSAAKGESATRTTAASAETPIASRAGACAATRRCVSINSMAMSGSPSATFCRIHHACSTNGRADRRATASPPSCANVATKWSSPSSSLSCWCACSHDQRALIAEARAISDASAG